MVVTSTRSGFPGRWLAVAAFGFAVAHPAHAHDFCVTTSAELQAALTAGSDGGTYNGEDNYISLVQGVYLTGTEPFHFQSTAPYTLAMVGGYTDAQCQEDLNSHNTLQVKLDGHGATGVLSIINPNGFVGMSGLTIQNGAAGIGAGLQVNFLATPHSPVVISALIIRNNHSISDAGGLYVAAADEGALVNDTLISNNSADNLYGAGYIVGDGQNATFASNTISRNTSDAASDPVGGLYLGGTSAWLVTKNIFWNNTGAGLYVGNATTSLRDNDYGTIGGMTPSADVGHISQNPSFVDPANGNFYLAGDSPLLGYSTFLAGSGSDLRGYHHPTSGAIDLGAHYESIFVDAFEPAQ